MKALKFIIVLIGCSLVFAQWYTYPTYQEYVEYMEKWQEDYPLLCKVFELGKSVQGRKILAIKISDNVSQCEQEPKLIHTSVIHGNATHCYMTGLHMIDTLLSSYGTDERITELVDYAELWVLPLVNPDGTYHDGDNNVQGAIRRNANNKDLNLNWPCPCMEGNHKYFGIYDSLEPETKVLIDFHKSRRFNLSINTCCGVEAVLWPFAAVENKICDEGWYAWAAKRFADEVHENSPDGFMTSCGGDGIGHCFSEVYEVHGTRLDFCPRFAQVKGVEMESQLPGVGEKLKDHWEYFKKPLFEYYELLHTGVQGVVSDASTKEPINNANITAVNHDYDSAAVYTDSTGFYLRFIEKGTYSLTFSHPGYYPKTVDDFTVDDYSKKYELNVELESQTGIESINAPAGKLISIMPVKRGVKIEFSNKPGCNAKVSIFNSKGKLVRSFPALTVKSLVWDGRDDNCNAISNGCYFVKVQASGNSYSMNFMFIR